MTAGRSIKSEMRRRIFQQDKALRAELQAVAETYTDLLQSKHEAVVRDWTHRPKFQGKTYVSKRQILSTVYPVGGNAKYYLWTDKGTKPHDIRPKRARYLKFQVGYDARTAPGAKSGVGTGRKFGAWRSALVIHHPGTKARKFSEKFNKDILPDMRKDIENAIRRALRRA